MGYRATGCPGLSGCVSQGTTREDAVVNLREAIKGYVRVLTGDGLPVPDEKSEAISVAV
jgi:predicted RNase H-like HicB family nuclease